MVRSSVHSMVRYYCESTMKIERDFLTTKLKEIDLRFLNVVSPCQKYCGFNKAVKGHLRGFDKAVKDHLRGGFVDSSTKPRAPWEQNDKCECLINTNVLLYHECS